MNKKQVKTGKYLNKRTNTTCVVNNTATFFYPSKKQRSDLNLETDFPFIIIVLYIQDKNHFAMELNDFLKRHKKIEPGYHGKKEK